MKFYALASYSNTRCPLTGGDDNTTFYISGSYRDEEGVQLNNKFTRMSAVINLDQKVSEKFSIGTNLTVSRVLNKRVKGDNFLDGVYSGAVKSLPYFVPFDENGAISRTRISTVCSFPKFQSCRSGYAAKVRCRYCETAGWN